MARAVLFAACVPLAVLASFKVASPCNAHSADGCSVGAGVAGQDHLLLQTRGGVAARTPSYKQCEFVIPPETPYFWDENCTGVGCWADGVNSQCRFCDYEGVECPDDAWYPRSICEYDTEPVDVGYYYDPECPEVDEGLGCNSDGKHQGCRFCGGNGTYSSIKCPEQCTFPNEPATPHYYDESCVYGMIGCMADGIHVGCRYCGRRPFEDVPCPASANIPTGHCWFRNEPGVRHYWNSSCSKGMLGCWADGMHAECRYCGGDGAFASIPCPEE